jgi:hypothetical protein
VLDQALAAERDCCTFVDLAFEPRCRRLRPSALEPDGRAALDAISAALAATGPERRPRGSSSPGEHSSTRRKASWLRRQAALSRTLRSAVLTAPTLVQLGGIVAIVLRIWTR